MRLLLEGLLKETGSLGAEDLAAHSKRIRVLKHMHKVSQVLLLIIRGRQPDNSTFLVVSQDQDWPVRYYDSLHELHVDCLRKAHILLDFFRN